MSPNRKDAPPLQSRLFHVVLNLGILLLDNFTKRKNKVGSNIFNSLKCLFLIFSVLVLRFYSYTRYRNVLTDQQLQRVNLLHSS